MSDREVVVYLHFCNYKLWRTPPTTEAELLSEAIKMAEMLKAAVVRVEASKKGVSDLLICYRGRFIACELKDDAGVASMHQTQFINKVCAAGGKGDVCRTLQQVFRLITGAVFGEITAKQ